MKRYIFKPHTTIVVQGDVGESMYLIEKGFTTVHIKSETVEDTVVGILNPGDFFGEMSLLTGENRTATVISETEVLAYEITKEILTTLIKNNPELYENFAKVIADKMNSNQEHLKKLANPREDKNLLMNVYLLKIGRFFRK